jgi:hypothetical protein
MYHLLFILVPYLAVISYSARRAIVPGMYPGSCIADKSLFPYISRTDNDIQSTFTKSNQPVHVA